MGRILLICRLAARDLRGRPVEAVLMLLVITAATTTLTLGLALSGVTSHPYLDTRAATAGPDVVAQSGGSAKGGGSPADLTALAIASVAVLVGGRMAGQTRRVGLLKAVGGTPKLVAAVLLAEHLVLALVAAAAGLAVGWLAAPLLSRPIDGLIGSPGAPSLTAVTVGAVVAVALAVALLATFVPAIRAARTSTVAALAEILRSETA